MQIIQGNKNKKFFLSKKTYFWKTFLSNVCYKSIKSFHDVRLVRKYYGKLFENSRLGKWLFLFL